MQGILAVAHHRTNDDPGGWVVCVFFFAAIAFSLSTIFYRKWLRRKRTAALGQVAANLGLEFDPLDSDGKLQSLSLFKLFSKGRKKQIVNVVQGGDIDRRLAMFDYEYVTGHGRSKIRWVTTVLSVQMAPMQLPQFSIRRKRFTDAIVGWFRDNNINFPSLPSFSSRHLLLGQNGEAVRTLFNEKMLDFCERNPDLQIEGAGQTLLCYRTGKRVPPTQLGDFLSRGLEFATSMNLA